MFESFILTGGKSSRMGREKSLLKFNGKTLLEKTIKALKKAESKKISIVISENSNQFDFIDQDISVVSDIYKNRGTLGGIQTGLCNCQEKYAIIVACDFPFLSSKLIEKLIRTIKDQRVDCVAPIQKDGIVQPLYSVYDVKKCVEEITKLVNSSAKLPSTTEVLKMMNSHFVEFKEYEVLPGAEYFLFNINTPKDFEQALLIYEEVLNK